MAESTILSYTHTNSLGLEPRSVKNLLTVSFTSAASGPPGGRGGRGRRRVMNNRFLFYIQIHSCRFRHSRALDSLGINPFIIFIKSYVLIAGQFEMRLSLFVRKNFHFRAAMHGHWVAPLVTLKLKS